MKDNNAGLLIVFSGPSGAGKGTVLRHLIQKNDKSFFYSVSATTRPPRKGEIHGKHYYFTDKPSFMEEVKAGRMLEYAEYCDNYYGTPASAVNEMLSKGMDVLLEIEVTGAKQIKEKCPDAVMIFVAPPSFEELFGRLSKRGTEAFGVIENRLRKAKDELSFARDYDYIIINDIAKRAANDVKAIIRAEKRRTARMLGYIKGE